MSQHDFNIANQTFPSTRDDINAALQAAATLSAGGSAPSATFANQIWLDTSVSATWVVKLRNAADDGWHSLMTVDTATGLGKLAASNVTVVDAGALFTGTDAEAVLAELATITQGKKTIAWPALSMTSNTTNGAADGSVETTTNKVMAITKDFDATTSESVQFAIQMPKSWNRGTITAKAVWSHPATATNFGVVWAVSAVALGDDDALDVAFGTAQQVADTGGTTNDIYITAETPAITVAGTPGAEEWVQFKVARLPSDGSDTMAVDARLHGIRILYTTDANTDD